MRQTDIKWPTTVKEANLLQRVHLGSVRIVRLEKVPESVAGVDAAFSEDNIFAAVCLYSYPDLQLIEQQTAVSKAIFPYVPGYLLFREGPAMIAAIYKLKKKPDVLLIDGHGTAHPRGIGSASHLGVLLDIPAIGCAKTRLIGAFEEPGSRKGCWSSLNFQGSVVGVVLRTRDAVKPLFISPGHKIDLSSAIKIINGCTGNYRIPEPLRCADMTARKLIKTD